MMMVCVRLITERRLIAAVFFALCALSLVLCDGSGSDSDSVTLLMPFTTTVAPTNTPTSEVDDEDDNIFDKLTTPPTSWLLLSILIVITLIVILSVILMILCCCCYRSMKEMKQLQTVFRDGEEGDVELVNFTENDNEEGKGKESDGDAGKDETNQPKAEEEHTLSTFGHIVEVKKESDETKEDNDKMTTDASAKRVDSKEEESAEKAGPEDSESKQSAEQDKGQNITIEGTNLQPIPVAPPIIFNLSPATAKMGKPPSSEADTATTKDKSTDDSSAAAVKVTVETTDFSAAKPSESLPLRDKSENQKEVAITGVSSPENVAQTEEKSENTKPVASDSEVPKSVFDDIEQALGMALKDLGDF